MEPVLLCLPAIPPPTPPANSKRAREREEAVIDQPLRAEQNHSEASGPEGEDRRIGTCPVSVDDSSGLFCLCSDGASGGSSDATKQLLQLLSFALKSRIRTMSLSVSPTSCPPPLTGTTGAFIRISVPTAESGKLSFSRGGGGFSTSLWVDAEPRRWLELLLGLLPAAGNHFHTLTER